MLSELLSSSSIVGVAWQSFGQLTVRFGLPDFVSSHWVYSMCLDRFVSVRFLCLC